MSTKTQFVQYRLLRNTEANLAGRVLEVGEPFVATDTGALYVGTDIGNVKVNDGVKLNENGKLDESILPSIAITDTTVVTSEAGMLALDAQKGDVAVRTDQNKTYILKASPANVLENWVELRTPDDGVLTINGKTGTVTLTAADIGAEPSFTKNTAFNKDFGTTSDTVARGDHSHEPMTTSTTQAVTDKSTKIATTEFVDNKINDFFPEGIILDGGTL